MIYLKNISTPQEIFIPKNREMDGELVFTLKNTINQSINMQDVNDFSLMSLYYKIFVVFPAGLPSGEYEYTLSDNAGVLSTGLLIVGDSLSPTDYSKVIQYEQCE